MSYCTWKWLSRKNSMYFLSSTFWGVLPILFRFLLFCIPIEPPFPQPEKGAFTWSWDEEMIPGFQSPPGWHLILWGLIFNFFHIPRYLWFMFSHMYWVILSPSKPLNSKQTTCCSHIVDASAEIEAELIPVQLPLFSKILWSISMGCLPSGRMRWCLPTPTSMGGSQLAQQNQWGTTSSENGKVSPPTKGSATISPNSTEHTWCLKPKFGGHQTRQLSFLGLLVGQCRILRHPHRLENTQFNKVSQLNQNHKDPTKVKHHEECSLVQRVDIPCIFNHIHGQTVARMNLAWTFHCWHFERHTHTHYNSSSSCCIGKPRLMHGI